MSGTPDGFSGPFLCCLVPSASNSQRRLEDRMVSSNLLRLCSTIWGVLFGVWLAALILLASVQTQGTSEAVTTGGPRSFDVVVVGGTPGGVRAAVAAARRGHKVAILERTKHIGGLAANGLGATDIATRGATGGLFLEFVRRVHDYYVTKYGEKSLQVEASSDGYH